MRTIRSARRQRGRALIDDMFGSEFAAKRDASTTDFNRQFRQFTETVAFGDIWSRPGLERKTRSMLCIAMLIALGKPEELKLHVDTAISNGCTVEEIHEVLYQAVAYCGIPATSEAFKVAEAVLGARGLLPKKG